MRGRTLGELGVTLLEIRCSKCERHGRERVARLIDRFGRDARLPDLRPSSRAIVRTAAPRSMGAVMSTFPSSAIPRPKLAAWLGPTSTRPRRAVAPQRAVRRRIRSAGMWNGCHGNMLCIAPGTRASSYSRVLAHECRQRS